jgi:hypothetical protein
MKPDFGRNIPYAGCNAGEPIEQARIRTEAATLNACGTAEPPDVHDQLYWLADELEQRAAGLRELGRSLPLNIPYVASRELRNLVTLTRRMLFETR